MTNQQASKPMCRKCGRPEWTRENASNHNQIDDCYVPGDANCELAARLADAEAKAAELEAALSQSEARAKIESDSRAAWVESCRDCEKQVASLQAQLESDTKRRAAEIHAYRRRAYNQRVALKQLNRAHVALQAQHAAVTEDRRLQRVRAADAEIALNEARAQLREREEELAATRADACRMHYLGNLIRSRDQAKQDELTALMRKYPPAPRVDGPVQTSPFRQVAEASTRCAAWVTKGNQRERCALRDGHHGRCQAVPISSPSVGSTREDEQHPRDVNSVESACLVTTDGAGGLSETWAPELRDIVRFRDTPKDSRWYTVRGIDTSDKTALILCNDDNQALPAWHDWAQLELAEPSTSPKGGKVLGTPLTVEMMVEALRWMRSEGRTSCDDMANKLEALAKEKP